MFTPCQSCVHILLGPFLILSTSLCSSVASPISQMRKQDPGDLSVAQCHSASLWQLRDQDRPDSAQALTHIHCDLAPAWTRQPHFPIRSPTALFILAIWNCFISSNTSSAFLIQGLPSWRCCFLNLHGHLSSPYCPAVSWLMDAKGKQALRHPSGAVQSSTGYTGLGLTEDTDLGIITWVEARFIISFL